MITLTDLGDHDTDPGNHDRSIWVITMRRLGSSRWAETRTFFRVDLLGARPAAITSTVETGVVGAAELATAEKGKVDYDEAVRHLLRFVDPLAPAGSDHADCGGAARDQDGSPIGSETPRLSEDTAVWGCRLRCGHSC